MATIRVTTKGVEAIIDAYDNYDAKTQKKVRKVVARSITNIFRDAQSRVPIGRTGNLRARLRKTMSRKTLSGVVKSRAPHSWIVEHGTKKHDITPKRKKKLALFGGIFLDRVMHPGAKAKPFLTPAFYKERPKYVAALKEAIKNGD